MIEITSASNSIVKEIVKLHQKKYRNEQIIVEGKKAVNEALESGLKIKYVFSDDKTLLYEYKNIETFYTNEKIMEKISTTQSPSNVIAVVQKPEYKFDNFMQYKKIVLLDNIKDCGNLGTIIRTSAAFGIDGIILFNECADEFSPKTIRSAAGNIFKMPVVHCTIEQLKLMKKNFKIISTVVNSPNSINNFNVKEPYIIMFGSEADGLCKELLTLCDVSYTIPMKKNVESLNLAISAGIVLYEIFNR